MDSFLYQRSALEQKKPPCITGVLKIGKWNPLHYYIFDHEIVFTAQLN